MSNEKQVDDIKDYDRDDLNDDNPLLNPPDTEDGEKGKLTMTIDKMIDKIGFNYYHVLFLFITGLVIICDGVEIHLTYILSPILREKYNVSREITAFVVACVFVGFALGCFFSGIITRHFGRRYPLIIVSGIISLFNILCVIWDNLVWFSFCRFVMGFCVGLLLNFVLALSEILPSNIRDFIIGSIWFFWKLGNLYFTTLCFFLIDEKDSSLWKLVVILGGIPVYLAFVLSIVFFEESPRLLFVNGQNEQGFQNLQSLASKSNITITQEEKESIIRQINENKSAKDPSFFELLSEVFSFTRLSILVMLLWIFVGLLTYTSFNSLPVYLSRTEKSKITSKLSKESLKKILISNIAPLFSELIAGTMTSFAIIGRKITILFGFCTTGLSAFLQIFFLKEYYIFSSLISFFYPFAWNILKLYNIEAYPTSLRDFSFGFFQSLARFAIIMVPFTVNAYFNLALYGPSIAITVYSIIGIVLTILLPYDTKGMPLDVESNEEQLKLKNV